MTSLKKFLFLSLFALVASVSFGAESVSAVCTECVAGWVETSPSSTELIWYATPEEGAFCMEDYANPGHMYICAVFTAATYAWSDCAYEQEVACLIPTLVSCDILSDTGTASCPDYFPGTTGTGTYDYQYEYCMYSDGSTTSTYVGNEVYTGGCVEEPPPPQPQPDVCTPQSGTVSCDAYAGSNGIPADAVAGTASYTYEACTTSSGTYYEQNYAYTGGCEVPVVSCTSAANACGQTNSGTVVGGTCSVSAPANPAGYGDSCTSASNACGQTSSGTISCDGSCSASTPANPSGYGTSCTSSANNCGATNTGTISCDGSCSAVAPRNGQGCASVPGCTDSSATNFNPSATVSNGSCVYTPTASLSISPETVNTGDSATLTWSSTGATACTGTGFTAGGTSGSVSTGSLNSAGTSIYQVVCTGAGGTSSPSFASVSVLSPEVSISATPSRVTSGSTSLVSWSSTDVSSCTVSGPNLSSSALSGSQSVAITAQSLFTITCSGLTDSVTVNILPVFQEF